MKEITKELKKIENCLDFWGGINREEKAVLENMFAQTIAKKMK